MKWALWKAKVTDDNVRFLHVDDLPHSGFASVYLFTESDAKSMQALGTYKSFKGTVHCDTLKVDCDNEEASIATETTLKALGVGYEKYTTGGRGSHYHVARTAQPSHMLPAVDKAYVGRTFPGVDLSFYHHVGWYRQPGATHQRTGQRKALVEVVKGPVLDMTQETAEVYNPAVSYSGEQPRSVFDDHKLRSLTVPYERGERRNRLCAVAARLSDLNQPLEWAFAYLANVNLYGAEPLPEEELHRILRWAFEERTR